MNSGRARAGSVATLPAAEDKRHQKSITRRPQWVRLIFHHWESLRLRLSAEEIAAYLSLFCEASYYNGRLSLPIATVARRVRIDESILIELVSDHPELFEQEDGYLIILHAADEVSHALTVSQQRAAAGRRSGEVRRALRIVEGGSADE